MAAADHYDCCWWRRRSLNWPLGDIIRERGGGGGGGGRRGSSGSGIIDLAAGEAN